MRAIGTPLQVYNHLAIRLKLSNADIRKVTFFDYSPSLQKSKPLGLKNRGIHVAILALFHSSALHICPIGITVKSLSPDSNPENFTYFTHSSNMMHCNIES